MSLCAIQRATLWSVIRTVQSTVDFWITTPLQPPTPHSHALPSVPPMGKLTDNFSNDNSKPHNVCVGVIYYISFVVWFTIRFVAFFVESTFISIEWPIVQLYPFEAVGKWSEWYVTGSELQPSQSWCSGSHFGRWTQIESILMRVFVLRCPWLHSQAVVVLPLRCRRQLPISAVEKVVVEPISSPLSISIESIRLSFFRKSTRKNWGKEKQLPTGLLYDYSNMSAW
jgi:hypothetical protein